MKKVRVFAVIMAMALLALSGCGKRDYDIDSILENQKILFIMSASSYDNPCAAGYFIDADGKKHFYYRSGRPFNSIEKEYAYLLEHYDEFKVEDFFDEETLKKCVKYLYEVDADAEMSELEGISFDYPIKRLYGVRMRDGQEEFVWLGEARGVEKGTQRKLIDKPTERIFEELGKHWFMSRPVTEKAQE